MELLFSKGVDMNARNETGQAPVFTSSREGDLHVNITRVYPYKRFGHYFFIYHSEVKSQAKEEQTPVLWAFFKEVGVDCTAVNAKRQSLLHIVERQGGRESCFTGLDRFKVLMGKGLDPLAGGRDIGQRWILRLQNGAHNIVALFKPK